MKPFDMRLLRHALSARKVFAVGMILGLIRAVAMVVWCFALAALLTLFIAPHLRGSQYGLVLAQIPEISVQSLMFLAAAALLVRALSGWFLEMSSAQAAARVKEELRAWGLVHLTAASPLAFTANGRANTQTATVLGRGLDSLDSYFANYVPQLLVTLVATPVLLGTLWFIDPLSALIVTLVFPIIPIFMVLIGLTTKKVQEAQWRKLGTLSRDFLDILAGLATLKIFRRELKQRDNILVQAENYRRSTVKVLRVTFLSGFVLDLAGTFSVALVAVTVGTRLISGEFSLFLGLLVLFLLPEVFLPIRQVGAAFHASAEGLQAADELFELVSETSAAGELLANTGQIAVASARANVSDVGRPGIDMRIKNMRRGDLCATAAHSDDSSQSLADSGDDVSHSAAGKCSASITSHANVALELRATNLVLGYAAANTSLPDSQKSAFTAAIKRRAANLTSNPINIAALSGQLTVLRGSSGSGKTTLINTFLGFLEPQAGVAYAPPFKSFMPQQTMLMQGSVFSNITLGAAYASKITGVQLIEERLEQLVGDVLHEVGLGAVDPQLQLGVRGSGLSGGQQQRVALARALLFADLVPGAALLLDEPSSHLDTINEQLVITAVQRRLQGRAVLVSSHREAWCAAADKVYDLGATAADCELESSMAACDLTRQALCDAAGEGC